MPLASPRSVTRAPRSALPVSCQVSQSCGRHTASVRAALSGSCSASQRSLLTVNAASGTEPTASAHSAGPPSSSTRSAAACAERMSFHSSAGRTTSPAWSRHTIPCCWPPTETAATSPSPPACWVACCNAVHQAPGSTSVPSGWAARPWRTSAPVPASRTTTLHDWVEESIPATSVTSHLQHSHSHSHGHGHGQGHGQGHTMPALPPSPRSATAYAAWASARGWRSVTTASGCRPHRSRRSSSSAIRQVEDTHEPWTVS